MDPAERVVTEITVGARADVVWRALRDPIEIRRWFGWDYDELEEEIDFIFLSGASSASEADGVLRVEGGDQFTLEDLGDRTEVRVTRTAPAEGVYDEIDEGWLTFVQQLRFALERHPSEDRRTLLLTGEAGGPEVLGPVDALGLAHVASIPAGDRYQATSALDEAVTGELWFRSQHQTAVSVDGYGDGLLVVTEQPAEARPPHGGVSVLITTYGFDDASFDRVRERWTAWWDAHYRQTTVVPEP